MPPGADDATRPDVDLVVVVDPSGGAAVRAASDLAASAGAGLRAAVLGLRPGLPAVLLDVVRAHGVRPVAPGETLSAGVVLVDGKSVVTGPGTVRAVRGPVVPRDELPLGGGHALLAALDDRVPGWREQAVPQVVGEDAPVGDDGPHGSIVRRLVPQGSRTDRRVLLVSSNGSGMGHLTRLVAMARRASAATEVHLVSMSSAVPLGAEGVLPYQYVPSADDLGISARRWNPVLGRRLDRAVERLAADVVVFDGTYPYRPVSELKERYPHLRTVWSRRPMWKPGRGARQLALSSCFDLVLEPGELAADLDRGLTVGRDDALQVRPITLLDDGEVLPREQARAALGVDPDAPTALLTLGAGSWQDVDSDLGALVGVLREAVPQVQLHLVRPSISRSAADLGQGVRAVSVYPLSRYVRAFDLVVTAAGYNTFHETVAFARPGAFVGVAAQLDDQSRRAAWAEREGAGLDLHPRQRGSVLRAAELLREPDLAESVSRRCRAVWPGNGAADAMRAVEAVVDGAEAGDLVLQEAQPWR